METLTHNLKQWRKDRNITNSNYGIYVNNILEELLEPIYNDKEILQEVQNKIYSKYFRIAEYQQLNENDIIDALQDIQVFSINETELMGYDNEYCNNETFKEINSREQCPKQKIEWSLNGAKGKWNKNKNQDKATLYEANYIKA